MITVDIHQQKPCSGMMTTRFCHKVVPQFLSVQLVCNLVNSMVNKGDITIDFMGFINQLITVWFINQLITGVLPPTHMEHHVFCSGVGLGKSENGPEVPVWRVMGMSQCKDLNRSGLIHSG